MLRVAGQKNWCFIGRSKHPAKLTALLYLKEAIAQERYEDCAEIIGIAKEFGAADIEIYYLLEDPRRNPT